MRILPRVVARTPIGKQADVKIRRKGETKTLKVTVGRLPETEEAAAQEEEKQPEAAPEENGGTTVLGLSLAAMTDELRSRFNISDKVKGVVVTAVDATSVSAQKNIAPGDVIVEVTQEEVKTPEDVVKRVDAVKSTGRNSVLLLISDAKGELRFVAIPTNQ
jgi:serine protease Do